MAYIGEEGYDMIFETLCKQAVISTLEAKADLVLKCITRASGIALKYENYKASQDTIRARSENTVLTYIQICREGGLWHSGGRRRCAL